MNYQQLWFLLGVSLVYLPVLALGIGWGLGVGWTVAKFQTARRIARSVGRRVQQTPDEEEYHA